MSYYVITRDSVIGALFAGVFSYSATIYTTNSNYLKVSAYLWGVPLMYFYILYIAWNNAGKDAAFDVSAHALLGILVTVFSIIFTLFIINFNKDLVIYLNIIILITAIFAYTYLEAYNFKFTSMFD
tara:strand:- start:179 stop:556 length:378 start_codon:yes stop_codon:yes gene_type:complete